MIFKHKALIVTTTFLLKVITNNNVLCLLATATMYNDASVFSECLHDLEMSELLRLKHSLQKLDQIEMLKEIEIKNQTKKRMCVEYCNETMDNNWEHEQLPKAMALTGNERGYHHHHSGPPIAQPPAAPIYLHPWQPEEKPSKLQTLFQISITALSFLSFGGYLLCLIVQAIKSKGTTYFHPVATAMTNTGNGGVKRIKIYRRSRRAIEKEYNDAQFIIFPPLLSADNIY